MDEKTVSLIHIHVEKTADQVMLVPTDRLATMNISDHQIQFVDLHCYEYDGSKEYTDADDNSIFVGGQLPEKVRPSVDAIRQLAKEKFGRDPSHIKVIAGMSIIVAETDEAARAKREELLSYGYREGALALFGGWTGIALSSYLDDEDFRSTGLPAIQSIVNGWASTFPGSDNLKWNKFRIAEYIILGGMNAKVMGSPKTVVDE